VTPDEVRAQIRKAEADRDALRGEMDAQADAGGGHIDREKALRFAEQLEDISARIWRLKSLLRTPTPGT